jgi:hypothetical protein
VTISLLSLHPLANITVIGTYSNKETIVWVPG